MMQWIEAVGRRQRSSRRAPSRRIGENPYDALKGTPDWERNLGQLAQTTGQTLKIVNKMEIA
jgi:hypothetical protein